MKISEMTERQKQRFERAYGVKLAPKGLEASAYTPHRFRDNVHQMVLTPLVGMRAKIIADHVDDSYKVGIITNIRHSGVTVAYADGSIISREVDTERVMFHDKGFWFGPGPECFDVIKES